MASRLRWGLGVGGTTLVATGLVLWWLRGTTVHGVSSPNVSLSLSSPSGSAGKYTYGMLVVVSPLAPPRLVLSKKPLRCENELYGSAGGTLQAHAPAPAPPDPPEARDSIFVELPRPPATGPVYVDVGGAKGDPCNPAMPPMKSKMVVHELDDNHLRATLVVDEDGHAAGPRTEPAPPSFRGRGPRCFEHPWPTRYFHLVGSAEIDVPLCRPRDMYVRALLRRQ